LLLLLLDELRANGYRNLEEEWNLLDYLETYVPRWKRGERAAQSNLPSTQDLPE
jgi:hypothetical protein